MNGRSCIAPEEAVALVEGRLDEGPARAIDEHVADCDRCRRIVAALVDSGADSPPSEDLPPAPGRRIGRYTVLSKVGQGGMGFVVRARDETLHREVALKWIRVADDEARARALREARALAQLTHPNVVTIHDAGEDEGSIFLAMELVAGRSLREWLGESPRSSAEIVRVVVDAAHGLQGAHRAGLVHRDVKPSNVLVREDGRGCIADFGLARGLEPDAPGARLTEPGRLVGTPSYMAPEQLAGGQVDARSDQFSLAQTAWEALAGRSPFVASALGGRLEAIQRGPVGDLAGRARPRVETALRRALHPDPTRRFGSLEELAAALAPRPLARRVAIALPILALLLAGLGALAARGDDCAAPEDPGRWKTERQALRAALLSTGAPHARGVADRAQTQRDAWARELGAATVAACRRGAARARRQACLQGRGAALRSLLTVVRRDPRATLDAVVQAAARLERPQACAEATPPRPFELPARDNELLVRAELDLALGRDEEAARLATIVLARLGEQGGPGPRSRALLAEGRARLQSRQLGLAEERLRAAAREAARARDDARLASAWLSVIEVVARRLGFSEAHALIPVADAAVERAGAPPELRAELLRLRAGLERELGDPRVALPLARQNVELRRSLEGGPRWELSSALSDLGLTFTLLGEVDRAREAHDEAIATAQGQLGDAHREIVRALNNRAVAELAVRRTAAARPLLERALAMARQLGREEHAETVYVWHNLAEVEAGEGRYGRAIELQERARELRRRHLGAEHAQVADSVMQIAVYRMLRGDPPDTYLPDVAWARANYRRWGYRLNDENPAAWLDNLWAPAAAP